MSPEEKIEAAKKLIAEARAEMAAKKRNRLKRLDALRANQGGAANGS